MSRFDPSALLAELHAGRTSRNRDFHRFAGVAAARVLHAYRRLRSLTRELRREGVEARLRAPTGSGEARVEVLIPAVRYRRVVLLAPWELEFLLVELGSEGRVFRETGP
ncbi:MAG: hypothetical protein HZB55_23415 [Deltaproteobacteria bacterium]|nr:hypothetical protein [Deltaproteobacteria bacterium]